ncbi:MAG: hypothetical protein A2070_01670 [Bdellovibrionales bacterium GWC1_52_8]|nr:MAG: hypothetical protein A2070_01670 [Bdellovibrionales bacterium GWC1_52_8]
MWKRLQKEFGKWIWISLVLHVLAALLSTGFQNSDEHFQILEFLHARLGLSPLSDLSMEFQGMMRPWLQPLFYEVPVQLLRRLGIENPFVWATVIRLVSALVGWLSVLALGLRVSDWVDNPQARKWTFRILSCLWLLPVLHARHSSENLSGAVFVIGLCLSLEKGIGLIPLFLGGACLGLALHLRYQVVFMFFGFMAWMLFSAKERSWSRRQWGTWLSGMVMAGFVGIIADRVGYGRWTLAIWNYFQFNIVKGGLEKAGEYPWWDYFRRSWTETWPLLGFVHFISFFVLWLRAPRHVLTWVTLPFFFFHFYIGHKETRFLFPAMHLAPLVLVLAFAPLWSVQNRWRWVRNSLVALNALALLPSVVLPIWWPAGFYEEIFLRARQSEITSLEYTGENPYKPAGIHFHFYQPAGISVMPFSPGPGPKWIVHETYEILAFLAAQGSRGEMKCEIRFSAYSKWLMEAVPVERVKRLKNWTAIYCR